MNNITTNKSTKRQNYQQKKKEKKEHTRNLYHSEDNKKVWSYYEKTKKSYKSMHQIVTENFSKIKKITWTKGNMEEKEKEY